MADNAILKPIEYLTRLATSKIPELKYSELVQPKQKQIHHRNSYN